MLEATSGLFVVIGNLFPTVFRPTQMTVAFKLIDKYTLTAACSCNYYKM